MGGIVGEAESNHADAVPGHVGVQRDVFLDVESDASFFPEPPHQPYSRAAKRKIFDCTVDASFGPHDAGIPLHVLALVGAMFLHGLGLAFDFPTDLTLLSGSLRISTPCFKP